MHVYQPLLEYHQKLLWPFTNSSCWLSKAIFILVYCLRLLSILLALITDDPSWQSCHQWNSHYLVSNLCLSLYTHFHIVSPWSRIETAIRISNVGRRSSIYWVQSQFSDYNYSDELRCWTFDLHKSLQSWYFHSLLAPYKFPSLPQRLLFPKNIFAFPTLPHILRWISQFAALYSSFYSHCFRDVLNHFFNPRLRMVKCYKMA